LNVNDIVYDFLLVFDRKFPIGILALTFMDQRILKLSNAGEVTYDHPDRVEQR